ncbi:signal peptidase I [Granulicella sp. S156]|uniref:signal peptidase I n=1 Tax=Granulicella sp. S156 TaxID=1747224 RepID=UPI00131BDCD6|nr:signal peptidase I [Granulicella sp. S156]
MDKRAEKPAVVELNDAAAGHSKDAERAETPLEALSSLSTVVVVWLFLMGFVFQNMEIPSASMENTLLIGDHVVVDRSTLAPPTKWAPFVRYRPVQRGDVVVFYKPHSEAPDLILVKRAIAVPGDRVHLRKGVVYINGIAQSEPFAIQPRDDNYLSYRDDFPSDLAGLRRQAINRLEVLADCQDPTCLTQKAWANRTIAWTDELPGFIQGEDLVVPPGNVFVMGDNRTDSLDGRFWGFVPQENIMGRPLFVYWSFKTPEDQEDKTGMGDRIGFIFHVILHIFDGTRWSRELHVIR